MRLVGTIFLLGAVGAEAACHGFGLGDEAWDYVGYLAGIASQSPLPGDARQVLFDLFQVLEEGRSLDAAARACPVEVLTLLAQTLTRVEQVKGEAAMLSALDRAAEISQHAPGAKSQLDWASGFVHVLRGGADTAACKLPGSPRVYVYDSGDLTARPLACSAGMEGVEVFFHHFFLSSSCRTLDPTDADVLFVPFYSFCFQNDHLTPGNETAELDAINLRLVRSLAYFHGALREKHLFLFPHEFWDFPSWRDTIADAQFLVVEANPLEWASQNQQADGALRHCLSCFAPDKDVVLPGHTDYWTTRQLLALSKPWLERQYSVCYHGSFAHPLYDSVESAAPFNTTAGMTRSALASLRDRWYPRVSVGGHLRPVREYYERVTDCQYCFVPKGVGFTNGRLMETFFSGCVPVILSDAMVVPFDHFLPWPSFSLKLQMPRSPAEASAIVDYLEALPPSAGLRMHAALLEHRCWFDYGPHSEEGCSPYEGLLRVLVWQRRSRSPRRFWRHDPP